MKKILLSLVTLLCAINVCAQQEVTSINEKKMYTLECKSPAAHSTTRFISDTNGELKGQSAEGTHFRFIRAGETEYYYIQSIVTNKYLSVAAATSGTRVTLETEPTTSWQWQQSDAFFKPVINSELKSNLHLNNNTSGHLQIASGNLQCSQWTLREYDYVGPISDAEIPSGFYRFKNISADMYLAAPESLPAEADNYQSCTVTLSSEQDEDETHCDVWYVQNLGKNDSNGEHANEVIYRIWCFQGGYGLGSDANPRVVGSYNNGQKCPRLYSIQMTTDYKYVIAGHFYDDVNVGGNKNIFGLDYHDGGITNKKFLKPTDDKTTVSRAVAVTDKSNESAQWEISIVSPDELSKSVSIGSIGVGTFAFNSDVQIPEGVEAYVATDRGEVISLTQLEGTIPARMGVVLRKTDESKNDFTFEAVHGLGIGMSAVNTDGSLTSVVDHGNRLVGTLAETELAVGDYILTRKKVGGEKTDEVVFGKISEASNIAPNKAYLPADAVSQTRGFYTLIWGDDVETGIEEIQSAVKKDGIFVEGQQIVIVKNGLKYNAKGQRVK